MSSKPSEVARLVRGATRYAKARVRSQRELTAYLDRQDAPRTAAAQVLETLRRQGLVDDAACARLWAEHWARQGYAWSAIQDKLAAKGLDDAAIASAARSHGTASADSARAVAAVEHLIRRSPGRVPRSLHPARTDRARVSRWLASHGFDDELIGRVLDRVCGPSEEAQDASPQWRN